MSIGVQMKTIDDIEILEKTVAQLGAIHREVSLLSRKSPNDAVNPFKLKMINSVIVTANILLGDKYRPLEDFEKFDDDSIPTTSDVVFVVAQYMGEVERFRTSHIVQNLDYKWVYVVNGKPSDVLADAKHRGLG